MLAPLDTLDQLRARIAEQAADVTACGERGFVSLVLGLPEAPAQTPWLTAPQFQLLHGHREEQRAGYGVAGEWHASGPERLVCLRRHARDLGETWRQLDPDETGLSGFAMLGLAARPRDPGQTSAAETPDALLWLPEIALWVRRDQAAVILSARLPTDTDRLRRRWSELLEELIPRLERPAPGPLHPAHLRRCLDTPDANTWQGLVRGAIDDIATGELHKVVLARRLRVESSRRLDLARLNAVLGFFFPSCQIVNIDRADLALVAATPERLLCVRGNRIEVDALAGTTSRSSDAGRDRALAEALRVSTKNLHEHQLVIQAIRDALAPCASDIQVPSEPDIMRLNNAQHLWTRVTATRDGGSDIFDLADRLHPTPATNGAPRMPACDWLWQHDSFDRGWYTGATGIIEPDLSGELWVLLRCAEVRGRTADLYAGAGIVAGSDPLLEWRETDHKLAAMLTALRYA